MRRVLGCVIGLGLMCLLPWLFITASHSSHERLMEEVPVGTSLADLRSVLARRAENRGEVQQWTPTERHDPKNYGKVDGSTVKNEHGIFQRRVLGGFTIWNPTSSEQASFTGQISVLVNRSFADTAIVEFTVVEGKVVKVDWGYLPG